MKHLFFMNTFCLGHDLLHPLRVGKGPQQGLSSISYGHLNTNLSCPTIPHLPGSSSGYQGFVGSS